MSDFDNLFTPAFLRSLELTTDAQWEKIDRNKVHYFSTPSLAALLTDMENQIGVHPPVKPVMVTHEDTLGNWVGSVTLGELKQRIAALVQRHIELSSSHEAADVGSAWAMIVAISNRSNDLTSLGVYLYGLGVTDGVYDADA